MPSDHRITDILVSRASGHPETEAVVCRDYGSTSFGELARLASQLANVLRSLGTTRQDRIVVCHPRDSRFVVGIFGVLLADAIYVPVPESSPQDRLSELFADCEPAAVLCSTQTLELVVGALEQKRLDGAALVLLDRTDEVSRSDLPGTVTRRVVTWSNVLEASSLPPESGGTDADLAYIMYTSGSTGKAKGVAISHRALLEYADWATEYLSISPEDRILSTAPFYFDMSVFDVFAAVNSGATLYVADAIACIFPQKLVRLIAEHQITIWKSVSSLLSHVVKVRALETGQLGSLTHVLFAGERLPTKYLIAWMQQLPDATFYNAYGPTEATGISCIHRIAEVPASPSDEVPIGKPCANTEILLLSTSGEVVPDGSVGEIYIGGECLADGYWNNPVETAEHFVQDPLDPANGRRFFKSGDLAKYNENRDLVFVSRLDEQIKHQGYRIELQEINTHVLSVPGVRDAAVVFTRLTDSSNEEIIACVEGELDLDVTSVRKELKTRLAPYMVPQRCVLFEKLPRSNRGKIDKEELVAGLQTRPAREGKEA